MNKYESVVIINPNVDEAGLKEAYYMVFKFEANPTLIAELERVYRITDEVLKFITTRNID